MRFHCAADAYYIPEKIDIITETATMPRKDWLRSSYFAEITRAMHACGLLRCFSVYAFHELGKSYRSFYEGLTEYIESGNAPFTNGVCATLREYFQKQADGATPKLYVPFAGNLVWEPYEFLFLSLLGNHEKFYEEMRPYLRSVIADEDILAQLSDYQKAVIRKPGEETAECESEYDFCSYFKNIYINKYEPPVKGSFRTVFTDSNPVYTWEDFGKFVVWYGKMGSKSYKDKIEKQ